MASLVCFWSTPLVYPREVKAEEARYTDTFLGSVNMHAEVEELLDE